MKPNSLLIASLSLLSISQSFAVNTIWSTATDAALAGSGWNAAGGTHPDLTPAANTAAEGPVSWGGAGVDEPNGTISGNDFMGLPEAWQLNGTNEYFVESSWGDTVANTLYGFNASQEAATFEMYFSPDNLTQNAVLFETGGNGDGSGLVLEGNLLHFSAGDGGVDTDIVTVDLNDLAPSAAGTGNPWYLAKFSVDPSTDFVQLSVTAGANSVFSNSTTWTGNDWAGTDDSGLGTVQGTIGGDSTGFFTGIFGGNGGPTDSGNDRALTLFDGQIGAFSFAGADMASLTVVPEPSRAILLSLGGLLFLARRRRA